MKKKLIIMLVLITFVSMISAGQIDNEKIIPKKLIYSELPDDYPKELDELISFLNEEREKNNLELIIEDSLLTEVAKKQTEEMIRNDILSLESREGKSTNQILLENAIYDNYIYPFIFRCRNIEEIFTQIESNKELMNSLINADVNYLGISLLKKDEYFLTIYLVERHIFFDPFILSLDMESSFEARTYMSEFLINGESKHEDLLIKLFKYTSYGELLNSDKNEELEIIHISNIEDGNFNTRINLKKYKTFNQSFLIRFYDHHNLANIILKI